MQDRFTAQFPIFAFIKPLVVGKTGVDTRQGLKFLSNK